MVSWGTTANVSVPHPGPIGRAPGRRRGVTRRAAAASSWRPALSAGGAALAWLARITGRPTTSCSTRPRRRPGSQRRDRAAVVRAAPARRGGSPTRTRAFVGLTGAHGPGELARAVVEAVAFDVARCLELIAPGATELASPAAARGPALARGARRRHRAPARAPRRRRRRVARAPGSSSVKQPRSPSISKR